MHGTPSLRCGRRWCSPAAEGARRSSRRPRRSRPGRMVASRVRGFSKSHSARADRCPPPMGSITTATATCRFTYSAGAICWPPNCGARISTPRPARWRRWRAIVAHIRRRWPLVRILVRADRRFRAGGGLLAALASPPATKALDPDPFPRHSLRHAVYAALLHFGFETAMVINGASNRILYLVAPGRAGLLGALAAFSRLKKARRPQVPCW